MRSAFLACRIKLFLSILVCWGWRCNFLRELHCTKETHRKGWGLGGHCQQIAFIKSPSSSIVVVGPCWLVGEAALGIYSLVTLHCLVAVFPFLVFSFFHTPGHREQDWMV